MSLIGIQRTALIVCLVILGGCATSFAQTPGERFRKALKEIEANCASRKLAHGEVCGAVRKLKPADPLATPEGRFAHSIQIPNPVPDDSGYRPGMTSEEYFNHLCKTEAGEFIFKSVDNVEGLYQMRPRERATDDMQQHLYAFEDPFGYQDWEAREPEKFFVRPSRFLFFEKNVSRKSDSGTKGNQYQRYSGSDKDLIKDLITDMSIEQIGSLKSRFGYTWRGINRPHDRDLGIAGGELIVLDLQTKEVLAVRRGFIRTGNSNNLTGVWWQGGHVCPKEGERLFYTYEFISRVLKP